MTKFNLSIDLFTADVQDAVDVAQALRGVADRLAKFMSQPWSPYALQGTIFSKEGKRSIGTWSVDPEATIGLTITESSDPDSRVLNKQYPKITDAQAALLTRALAAGNEAGMYIYGSEVRAARVLEKLRLLTLVDDGEAPMGGNRDGERWSIEKLDRSCGIEILNERAKAVCL